MEYVIKAEKSLEPVFKSAPKLPKNFKDFLVKVWPWLALIGGVIQFWAAWSLWDLVNRTNDIVNYVEAVIGANIGYSTSEKFFIYLSIATLVLNGVIMLMAYPGLAKKQRKGWDLLFLVALLNAVYGVFSLFIPGRGFGSLLGLVIGSAVGFYLLFQVKDSYVQK